MPVGVKWDDDERTRFLVTFDRFWTWDEVNQAVRRGKSLLESSDTHPVDVIIDSTKTMTLIKSDTHIHTREVLERINKHNRIKRLVIVGASGITNSFLTVFLKISTNQLNPQGYSFFSTVKEAREHLISTREEQ